MPAEAGTPPKDAPSARSPAESPPLFGRHGGFGGRGIGPGGKIERARDRRATLLRLWGYLRRQRAALVSTAFLVAASVGLTLLGPYLLSRAIDGFILPGDLRGLLRISGLLLLVYALNSLLTWLQSFIMAGASQRTVRTIRDDLFARLQRLPLRFFDQSAHGDLMSLPDQRRGERQSGAVGQCDADRVGDLDHDRGRRGDGAAQRAARDRQSGYGHERIVSAQPLGIAAHARRVSRAAGVAGRPERLDRGDDHGAARGQGVRSRAGRAGAVRRGQRDAAPRGDARADLRRVRRPDDERRQQRRARHRGGRRRSARPAGHGDRRNHRRVYRLRPPVRTPAERHRQPVQRDPRRDRRRGARLRDHGRDARNRRDGHRRRGNADRGRRGVRERRLRLRARRSRAPKPVAPRTAGADDRPDRADRRGQNHDHKPADPLLRGGRGTHPAGRPRYPRHSESRAAPAARDRPPGHVLDTFLFSGSVRDNIRYGRPDATDAEIAHAARQANADTFIHRLPQGYDTPLSERGSNLSQGQRQLLAIARAILADPRILILDEATSSVDTRTEKHIQQAMRRLMAGRTSFVIAHRLSTITGADQILVIQNGAVIERGTHDDLLAQNGFYARLHAG